MPQNKFIRIGNRLHREMKTGTKKLRKTKWKSILWKGLAGIFALIVLLFLWYSKDLPTPSKINAKINIPSTQILDRNGKLLYAVSGNKKRFVIPLSDMPDSVKQATIALEDQSFYTNHGIEIKSIIRSVFVDVIARQKAQGGSTITQQFVKNALLTSNKSFSRKIKEAILAVEISAIYPKDKILEYYLNEIPYGSTAYGIEAASRTFFGKPSKELTLSEAATLAALPQAPTYYSPYGEHKDALIKRRDFALDQMVKLKYITKDQAVEAKKQTITFLDRKDTITAPHFVFYIQQLIADKYGDSALQNDGLKITTSLDLDVQKKAEDAVASGSKILDRYKANNAALVSVQPKTGEVLAMVGSRDYFNSAINGQVNVTTSNRQPGSSFKPIVYATAFKDKYNPAYPLFDLTTDFGGGYKPVNYDGVTHGPVSMRTALSNSLNIPAVKTLGLVGVNNAINTAKDLGITTLTQPDRYGLALVLGAGEVKPLEMAGAFSAFGNNGQFNPTTAILKVEDHSGHILEEYKTPPQKKVLDPQIAYLISDILSDGNARKLVFGFTNALTIPNHRVAVKTGTTSSNHDAWTVGYTPQISTAVWVGNTDNTAMKAGADGSVVAAPIWNNFMQSYLKDQPNEDFQKPDGIVQATVDFLSNKLPTDNSPSDQRRTDIFASWNAPKQNDDIHIKIRINKINGKAATDQTPAQLIEERFCANIHSEKPDNPSWEGPVRAWAQANGLDCTAPTEQDDSYNSIDNRPVATITTPKNNATVNGTITITSDVKATYGIKDLIYWIDGQDVGHAPNNPYSISYDTTKLSDGAHQLNVQIIDNNGISSNGLYYTINVSNKNSGSSNVTISSINASPTAVSVSISWTTSVSTKGVVQYGTSPSLGQTSASESDYATTHAISIGGLLPKTTYYYRITSTTQTGQQAQSDVLSFQTK